MSETRKTTLPLECRLTELEIRTAAKALAEAIGKRARVEAALDTFKAQMKAEITGTEGEIARNTVLVNSEREFRMVDCEVNYDFTKGVKTTTRMDTGEVVREEAITSEERQQLLEISQA